MKKIILILLLCVFSFVGMSYANFIGVSTAELGYEAADLNKAEIADTVNNVFTESQNLDNEIPDGAPSDFIFVEGGDDIGGVPGKYYTYNIVDGGYYRIVNVKTGKYMEVKNASVTDGTIVTTNVSTTGTNQIFKVKYLGQDTYEFYPYYVNMNLDVNLSDVLQISAQSYTSEQAFKINPLSSTTYSISTKESGYLDLLSVKYSVFYLFGFPIYTDLKDVVTKAASSFISSSKAYSEWRFERYEYSADTASKYYIQSYTTGKYLTVPNYSTTNSTYTKMEAFSGGENQLWKQVYNSPYFYYSPMHQTEMNLDHRYAYYSSTRLIKEDPSTTYQKFTKVYAGNFDGSSYYYLKTYSGYYLVENTAYNYITTTSNVALAAKWKFTTMPFNDPETSKIEFIQDYGNPTEVASKTVYGSMTAYEYYDIYTFHPTVTQIYTFTMNRTNDNIVFAVFKNGTTTAEIDETCVINAIGFQVWNVELTAGETYFVFVCSASFTETGSYNMKVDDDYVNSAVALRFENGNIIVNGENDIVETIWMNSLIVSIYNILATIISPSESIADKVQVVVDMFSSVAAFFDSSHILDNNSDSVTSLFNVYTATTLNYTLFDQVNYSRLEQLENDPDYYVNNDPRNDTNLYSAPSYDRGADDEIVGLTNHCPAAAGLTILAYYDRYFPDLVPNYATYNSPLGIYYANDENQLYADLEDPIYFEDIPFFIDFSSIVEINNFFTDQVMAELYDYMLINDWLDTIIYDALAIFVIFDGILNGFETLDQEYIDNLNELCVAIDEAEIGGGFAFCVNYGLKQYILDQGYQVETQTINLGQNQGNYRAVFDLVTAYIEEDTPLIISVYNNWTLATIGGTYLPSTWQDVTFHGIVQAHSMTIIGTKIVQYGGVDHLYYKVANSWGGYDYLKADEGWIADITAFIIS
ncbi:MAG: RICIN domain-containing protein [Firmicutes bacterium]|nr:RICIN domain-containing protein [Bacillota bacterium]